MSQFSHGAEAWSVLSPLDLDAWSYRPHHNGEQWLWMCRILRMFRNVSRSSEIHCRYWCWRMLKVLWALPGVFGHGALTKPMPRLVSGSELSRLWVDVSWCELFQLFEMEWPVLSDACWMILRVVPTAYKHHFKPQNDVFCLVQSPDKAKTIARGAWVSISQCATV